jgi:hypothetical protein
MCWKPCSSVGAILVAVALGRLRALVPRSAMRACQSAHFAEPSGGQRLTLSAAEGSPRRQRAYWRVTRAFPRSGKLRGTDQTYNVWQAGDLTDHGEV